MGETPIQAPTLLQRFQTLMKRFFAYWHSEHKKVFDAFADQSAMTANHRIRDHIQELRAYYNKHIHIGTVLRTKRTVFGFSGLKMLFGHSAFGNAVMTVLSGLKFFIINILFKSVFVNYLLFLLVMLGLNPQFALVSDISDACINESIFETCMQQENASQEVCLVQAMDGNCAPTTTTQTIDENSIEQLVAQNVPEGVILQQTDGMVEIIVTHPTAGETGTTDTGSTEPGSFPLVPAITLVENTLAETDSGTTAEAFTATIAGEPEAPIENTDPQVGTAAIAVIEQKSENELVPIVACSATIALPLEAQAWTVSSVLLQGLHYQAPKDLSPLTLSAFVSEIGTALDLGIATTIVVDTGAIKLAFAGTLFGLEAITFEDNFGKQYIYPLGVQCHAEANSCLSYCQENDKRMSRIHNRQGCPVYCGLADPDEHTVAETGTNNDAEQSGAATNVQDNETGTAAIVSGTSTVIDTHLEPIIADHHAIIEKSNEKNKETEAMMKEKIQEKVKRDHEANKNEQVKKGNVILPMVTAPHHEQVCSEQINLTCLSKCVTIGGNPLSCKVACSKTICEELIVEDESDNEESKAQPDALIIETAIDDTEGDTLCLTDSNCVETCIADGGNPLACKDQCTPSCGKLIQPTNPEVAIPLAEQDTFSKEEKERLCSGKEFGMCMQGCLDKGKENRICHTVCSRCEQDFIVTDTFDAEQQALFAPIMDEVVNTKGETIGVTFSAPIEFAVSENTESRAVIAEGTTITTKDSVPIDLAEIHTEVVTRDEIIQDAPELADGFKGGMHFGTEGKTLYFDKPVAITFPVMGTEEGDMIDIFIHHAGEPFGIRGLTTNPNSLCLNGEASDIGYQVPVINGQVTIYTCSASHVGGHASAYYYCNTDTFSAKTCPTLGLNNCTCLGASGHCEGRCSNSPYAECRSTTGCGMGTCLQLSDCVQGASCSTHLDCGPGTCGGGTCTCPTRCSYGVCGPMAGGTGSYDADNSGDSVTGGTSGLCAKGEVSNFSFSSATHRRNWDCGTGAWSGSQLSCGPMQEYRCGNGSVESSFEQCDGTGQAQCSTGQTCYNCACGVASTGACGSLNTSGVYDADDSGNALTGGHAGLCATGTVANFNYGTGYDRRGWYCSGTFGGGVSPGCGAFEFYCGDGIKTTTGGEQCDDGNTSNGDGCSRSGCDYEPLYYCNTTSDGNKDFSDVTCATLGDTCYWCGTDGRCAGRCSADADTPYVPCLEDGTCGGVGVCQGLTLCVYDVSCSNDLECGNGRCEGSRCRCPTTDCGPGTCGLYNGSGIYDANDAGDSTGIYDNHIDLCTSGQNSNYVYSGATHTWYWDCGAGVVSGDIVSCSAPERWCGDSIVQTGGGEVCDGSATTGTSCDLNTQYCNATCSACITASTGYCGSLSGTYIYDANNSGDSTTSGTSGLCGSGTVSGFAYVTTGHYWNWTCLGTGGFGNATCRANEEYCGNGSTGNAGGNEQCDDGNQTSSDGCSYAGCDWDPVVCTLTASPVPQVITGQVSFNVTLDSYEKLSQIDYGDGVTGSAANPHTYSSTGIFVSAATAYHSGNSALTDICTDMVIIYSGALSTGCRLFSGEEMGSTFGAGPPTEVSLQGIDEQRADLTGGGATIIETTVTIRSSTGMILSSGTGNVNFSQSIGTGMLPLTITTVITYKYGNSYHKITSTRVLGSTTPNDTGTSGYAMPFYCEDLTYCGDSATQNPNQIGLLGASGTGDEQCDDGANGTGVDGCNDSCKSSTNGTCGAKNGTGLYDANDSGDSLTGGSTGLCTTGTVSAFVYSTGSHSWTWSCLGSNSGSNASCNATELWCGDAVTGTVYGEDCDSGTGNGVECTPPYGGTCQFCDFDCTFGNRNGGICGNNTLETPDEQCDDGNTTNGDGCSYSGCDFETPTCSINASSGTINSGQTDTFTITVNTGWIGFTSLNFGNGNTITPTTLNTGLMVYTSSYASGTYSIVLTIYNALSGGSSTTNTCSTNITVTDCHDNDGDGQTNCAGDCDDTNNARYSGNTEICDLYDNDCDSSTNEGIVCCSSAAPTSLDYGTFSWSASAQDKTATYGGATYFSVTDYPYGCSGFTLATAATGGMSGPFGSISGAQLKITQAAGVATFLIGASPNAYQVAQSSATLDAVRSIMSRTGTNTSTYVQYGIQPSYFVTIPGNQPVGAYTGIYVTTLTYGQ